MTIIGEFPFYTPVKSLISFNPMVSLYALNSTERIHNSQIVGQFS